MATTAPAPVLRPLRLRDRRRPLPGLEAAARRGPALLQREVRLLRHQPVRRRGALPRSSGRPTARPRARCSRSSRRRWRCRLGCSSSRTRPTTTSTAGIMSRVFTPRRMAAIEPQVRDYAARTLDPLVGQGGFDFIARPRHRDPHAHHRHAARHSRGGPADDPRPHRRGPPARRGCHARGRLQPRGPDRLGLRRLHRLAGRAPLRRPDDRAAHGGVHRRGRDRAHPDPGRNPRLHRPALRGGQRDHDTPHRLGRQAARRTSGATQGSWWPTPR